ncbi:hypothetical protein [Ornithinibacillus halotolerans]|uniref:Uncharacterized protein n=1 Tax=Ornithinibacillus halotolerans TaxID=1274357 RepID=A0A916W4U1_9BACI|nr:hypothetical protein [Ornithinibacillus halotolerans]GGA65573.1 hypothetical protein GCM10008025_06740 [Ornithinibacillus halotolerans]
MKRFLMALVVYPTAGLGFYHTFLGEGSTAGLILLTVGLIGIYFELNYRKLSIE